MLRFILSDYMWEKIILKIKNLNFDKFKIRIYRGNIRIFIEAVMWKLRTGAPWRDLPSEFGPYSSIFNRYGTTSGQKLVFGRIFLNQFALMLIMNGISLIQLL